MDESDVYKRANFFFRIKSDAWILERYGKEVNLEQAQKLANQGYVVIACKKNRR